MRKAMLRAVSMLLLGLMLWTVPARALYLTEEEREFVFKEGNDLSFLKRAFREAPHPNFFDGNIDPSKIQYDSDGRAGLTAYLYYRPSQVMHDEHGGTGFYQFYLVKYLDRREGLIVDLYAATIDGGKKILHWAHPRYTDVERSYFGISIRTTGTGDFFVQAKALEKSGGKPRVLETKHLKWDAKAEAVEMLREAPPDGGLEVLDAEEASVGHELGLLSFSDGDAYFRYWRAAKAYHQEKAYTDFVAEVGEAEIRRFLRYCYPFQNGSFDSDKGSVEHAMVEGAVDERILYDLFLLARQDPNRVDNPTPQYKGLVYEEGLDGPEEDIRAHRTTLDAFLKAQYDLVLPPTFAHDFTFEGEEGIEEWGQLRGDGDTVTLYGTRSIAIGDISWIQEVTRYGRYSVLKMVICTYRGGIAIEGGNVFNAPSILVEHKDGHIFPRYVSNDPMTPEMVKSRYGIDLAEAKAAAERENAEPAKAPKAEEKATKDSTEAAEAKKPASDAAASPAKEPAETAADAIRRAERKRVLTWVGVIAVVLLLVAVILWLFRRMRRLQDAVRRQNEAHSSAPAQGDDDREGSAPRKGEDR